MSLLRVVVCDGTWPRPHPGPCTARLTLRDHVQTASQLARAGWTTRDGQDRCPAHSETGLAAW